VTGPVDHEDRISLTAAGSRIVDSAAHAFTLIWCRPARNDISDSCDAGYDRREGNPTSSGAARTDCYLPTTRRTAAESATAATARRRRVRTVLIIFGNSEGGGP
jgi:hypothetical protein